MDAQFFLSMAASAKEIEALNQHRQELEELATRKRVVEEQIAHIEQQIHAFEESYLEDTMATGNIIRGFDNYLGLRPLPPDKRKQKIKDSDRLFSRTSATFERSLGIQHEYQAFAEEYDSGPATEPVDDEDDDPTFKKKKKLKRARDSEDYLDVS